METGQDELEPVVGDCLQVQQLVDDQVGVGGLGKGVCLVQQQEQPVDGGFLVAHTLPDGSTQAVPVGALGVFGEEVDLSQLLADGRRHLGTALVQQADDHAPIPHGTVVDLILGAVEQGGFTQLTAAVDDVGAVGVQDAVQLLPATHEHLRRHGGAGDLIGVEPPEGQCRLEQSLHAPPSWGCRPGKRPGCGQ